MGTALRGFGTFKRDLLSAIFLAFGFTEFTYAMAAEISGFERRTFFNLSSDGWLINNKTQGGPGLWKLSCAFHNGLLTNNITQEKIHVPNKLIKPSRRPRLEPIISKIQTPVIDPIPSCNTLLSSKNDDAHTPVSSKIMRAIPEMLSDKEAYDAFSSDVAAILLKHTILWIDRKKVSRQDGILVESNGHSRLECPRCQFLNTSEATFCGNCGNQLQDTHLEKIRRKNLGLLDGEYNKINP